MDLDVLLHILAGLIPAEYLGLVTAAVAICAALDALLPQPPAGSRWVPVRRAVSWVALNLRYARNAVPTGAVPVAVTSGKARASPEVGRSFASPEVASGVARATPEVQAGAAVLEQAAGER